MPNTERAFELLDDNRWDDQPDEPVCFWCNEPIPRAVYAISVSGYCSSACDAAAQRDSEEDGL